jgi:hypothetical protein
VTSTSQKAEQSQTAWLRYQDGISVKTSFNDTKVFAYGAYDKLDVDGDGFVCLMNSGRRKMQASPEWICRNTFAICASSLNDFFRQSAIFSASIVRTH